MKSCIESGVITLAILENDFKLDAHVRDKMVYMKTIEKYTFNQKSETCHKTASVTWKGLKFRCTERNAIIRVCINSCSTFDFTSCLY